MGYEQFFLQHIISAVQQYIYSTWYGQYTVHRIVQCSSTVAGTISTQYTEAVGRVVCADSSCALQLYYVSEVFTMYQILLVKNTFSNCIDTDKCQEPKAIQTHEKVGILTK